MLGYQESARVRVPSEFRSTSGLNVAAPAILTIETLPVSGRAATYM
jgi:hypothetical protein